MLILSKKEAKLLDVKDYINWNSYTNIDLKDLDARSIRLFESYIDEKYEQWNKDRDIAKSKHFWALAYGSWLLCLIQQLVKIEEELFRANKLLNLEYVPLVFEKPVSSEEILRDVQDPRFVSKLRALSWNYANTGNARIEVAENRVLLRMPLRELFRYLFGIRADRVGGLSVYYQLRLEFTVRRWRKYYDSFPVSKRFRTNGNIEKSHLELIDSILPLCPSIVDRGIRRKMFSKRKIVLFGSQGLRNNDYYRLYVAHAVERGAKIIGYQHGGDDYGLALHAGEIEYLEIKNSLFLSWGYSAIGNELVDVLPVPSALLSSISPQKPLKSMFTDIIVVGTRMPLNNKFLNARPDLGRWLQYRKFKTELLKRLKDFEKIFDFRLLYRPYRLCENALSDKEFVMKSVDGVRFLEGDLHKALFKSKLVIIDHHGTTVNIALHSNIPTILLWESTWFPLNDFASTIFKELEICGIYHTSIESCINFLIEINFEVSRWWSRAETQRARKMFVEAFARSTDKNVVKIWDDSIIRWLNL